MLGFCSSFLRQSYSFQYASRRQISKTAVLMRSKKKANIDAFYDNIPKSRSKQMVPKYEPRTKNQQKYLEYLNHDKTPIVLGVGPAGCGKTMFACLQAIQELKAGNINKIILTRPIVPVEEEELGFLPGNLVKKMDPWTRPIFDIFLDGFGAPWVSLGSLLGFLRRSWEALRVKKCRQSHAKTTFLKM